ncbi:DUF1778 domain-containing protein [uncultured Enterovirga sp.]|uniref:type II toxin-antitoxin system TacA family antitoxin n=1 Tax=uncultured Enterovirga sp. TaxID=2026352 RepID=UPI0035CB4999
MEQRTTVEAKALIERGARALGLTASEFTVAAACRAARETLRDYELTVLTPLDHHAFMAAFDAMEPAPELVELMRLHPKVSKAS